MFPLLPLCDLLTEIESEAIISQSFLCSEFLLPWVFLRAESQQAVYGHRCHLTAINPGTGACYVAA